MGHRQKIQIAQDCTEILGNTSLSTCLRIGPFFRYLITAKEWGNSGQNRDIGRGSDVMKEICHLKSRLEIEVGGGSSGNDRSPRILPKFRAHRGQSICRQNGYFLYLITADNWANSG